MEWGALILASCSIIVLLYCAYLHFEMMDLDFRIWWLEESLDEREVRNLLAKKKEGKNG